MSESICPLCPSPLFVGLAKLPKCNHWGHALCLVAHLRKNGICPYDNCKMAASEEELILFEAKQPTTNYFSEAFVNGNEQNFARVFGAIRQRLVQLRLVADAPDSEFKALVEHCEALQTVSQPNDGTETVVETEQSKSVWDKFFAFLWKASPIILLAMFVWFCWYLMPLGAAAGALLEGLPAILMRLGTFLYSYVPEIVASGLAIFTTYFVGKKKVCD